MTTENKKSNMLFIQSDSDQSQGKNNQILNDPVNSLRLQGSFKFQGTKIKKNIFQEPQVEEQYHYEALSISKRNRKLQSRKHCFDENPEQETNIALKQSAHKESQPEEIKRDQQRDQVQQQKQQAKKNPQGKQKIKASKLLNFELDDSQDEDGEQNENDRELKERVIGKIQSIIKNESEGDEEEDEDDMVFSNTGEKDEREDEANMVKILPVSMVEDSNKYKFSLKAIQKKYFLDGEIQQLNSGLNYLYPQFNLKFKGYNTHILSCKKQAGSIGANYYISISEQNPKEKGQNYLGKVRSGNGTDVYNIFDNGERLIARSKFQGYFNSKSRELVATVCLKIGNGPRTIDVYMLKEGIMYNSLGGYTQGSEIGLDKLYLVPGNKQKLYHFQSRKPEWIPKVGKYFLNFNGKVKQASIRNFVLEDTQTKDKVLLFGKQKNNLYNIEIWNPISPWVGMGICATQFDKNQ